MPAFDSSLARAIYISRLRVLMAIMQLAHILIKNLKQQNLAAICYCAGRRSLGKWVKIQCFPPAAFIIQKPGRWAGGSVGWVGGYVRTARLASFPFALRFPPHALVLKRNRCRCKIYVSGYFIYSCRRPTWSVLTANKRVCCLGSLAAWCFRMCV